MALAPVQAHAQDLRPDDRQPLPVAKPRAPRGALPGQGGRAGNGGVVRQDDQLLGRLVTMSPTATQEPMPWEGNALAGVAPDAAVTALVRALDSADWSERARATTALLDRAVPDEQVWVHLSRGGLSPEAHARLLHVGQQRILHAARGALGIQMASQFESTDGVVVTALIPGMPAQKVLKPGDRIVSIEGQRIQVSAQLTAVVQARRPGDRIRVIVMRGERDELGRVKGGPDGRPLETRVDVDLELGSREDLDRLGDGGMVNDAPMIDAQNRVRAARLADAFPVPTVTPRVEAVAGEQPDVESHEDIRWIKEQLAAVDRTQFSAGLRALLRARLSALEAAARAPGLEAHEQAWLQAVADRFRELIPPALRDPPAGIPAAPAAR